MVATRPRSIARRFVSSVRNTMLRLEPRAQDVMPWSNNETSISSIDPDCQRYLRPARASARPSTAARPAHDGPERTSSVFESRPAGGPGPGETQRRSRRAARRPPSPRHVPTPDGSLGTERRTRWKTAPTWLDLPDAGRGPHGSAQARCSAETGPSACLPSAHARRRRPSLPVGRRPPRRVQSRLHNGACIRAVPRRAPDHRSFT
jgi:hypothetical protein